MEKSKLKLLLNAEPFGFGPTAAIATFFPYLRDKFEYIGFIGKNHTLDLQKDLPYDAVHDSTALSADEIKKIVSSYDIFFTALDFETGAVAKALGLKVIIYDPLTWYWKNIPSIVKESDVYLAQNFFGVAERLQNEKNLFPKSSIIIPAIVSQKRPKVSEKYILINLGGLQNPLLSVVDVSQYARVLIETIEKCIPSGEEIIITTSNAVAEQIADKNIRSHSRIEMHSILENTKYAFMTPGLGNMYDAAKFNIPTVWLPPANDSQGQQLDLVRKQGFSDGHVDWSQLGKSIDYTDEQSVVLENIKEAIYALSNNTILKDCIESAYKVVSVKKESAITALLDEFGTGGAEKVAVVVYEYSKSII